jgi:hypothetical protein
LLYCDTEVGLPECVNDAVPGFPALLAAPPPFGRPPFGLKGDPAALADPPGVCVVFGDELHVVPVPPFSRGLVLAPGWPPPCPDPGRLVGL